ncbi:MAG: heme-degrading domain-containing protein [Granulicella sp.]
MPTPDIEHNTEQNITDILRQERELTLPAFDPDIAWQLGNLIRSLAVERGHAIVIDIRRFGQPHQQLFYTAFPGTTPDNARWVQRKVNTVARFHRSSYHVGYLLKRANLSFSDRYNLPEEDYAAHGGCFPLNVTGAGVVGSITVSGLAQREDHELVVEAICRHTHRDFNAYRLSPES